MSKKDRKYVFIPIRKETRASLITLKLYGDTYDTVINDLITTRNERIIDDIAAQNTDHVDGDDEERGA